mgnify:CR=1 FL=1|jgi:DNA-directed RNA polymerase subunit RPC12/RpoP|tara:strand:+ start:137 stop:403 length:267 start_codon:yes stop_codon:yes gene_type:complete
MAKAWRGARDERPSGKKGGRYFRCGACGYRWESRLSSGHSPVKCPACTSRREIVEDTMIVDEEEPVEEVTYNWPVIEPMRLRPKTDDA